MMKIKKHCNLCFLQLRTYSKNNVDSTQSRKQSLLEKATFLYEPTSPTDLAKHLAKNIIYHNPGDVLIINKPYGVSCLGYKQKSGGVFKPSRYDQRTQDYLSDENLKKQDEFGVTIEQALPFLSKLVDERDLHFCIGLKRYVSGPVVLPCSELAFKKIKKSFFHANSMQYKDAFMYKALAICHERPSNSCGRLSGYATFQQSRNNSKEYVFVANKKISRRAVSGKFAVKCELQYKVLMSAFGCSLIDISFSKFSRHLPRLMLSYLGSPILGDSIYENRLLKVNGEVVIVEPKDRWRSANKHFEPVELCNQLNVKNFAEIRKHMPLFFTVYESTFPLFGDSNKKANLELIARTKPPSYFEAMAKLLNFNGSILKLLHDLETDESVEKPLNVSKDRHF